MKRDYTIAIDLGQYSVKAVAGYRLPDGKIHVEALSVYPSEGLRAGRIENISDATRTLSKVVSDLESRLRVKIAYAYASISSETIRSEHHTETINLLDPNMGVTKRDINILRDMMLRVLPADGEHIFDLMPQNYVIDRRNEVSNPLGTFGRTLSSTYNFVVGEKEGKERLKRAFVHSDISMKWCLAGANCAASAVLSDEEMEGGVALIDLGEGMTNLSIYYNRTLRYIASIPMGGAAINADIRSLRIPEKQVEGIKIKYGCARAKSVNGSIQIEGRTPRENRELPLYNLSVAIEQRMSDIIAFIKREISNSYYADKLNYGIVLCGGGSKLREVDELFMDKLDIDVRIAEVDLDIDEQSRSLVEHAEFACVMGLLRRGIDTDAMSDSKPCTMHLGEEEEEALEKDLELRAQTEQALSNERAKQGGVQNGTQNGAQGEAQERQTEFRNQTNDMTPSQSKDILLNEDELIKQALKKTRNGQAPIEVKDPEKEELLESLNPEGGADERVLEPELKVDPEGGEESNKESLKVKIVNIARAFGDVFTSTSDQSDRY